MSLLERESFECFVNCCRTAFVLGEIEEHANALVNDVNRVVTNVLNLPVGGEFVADRDDAAGTDNGVGDEEKAGFRDPFDGLIAEDLLAAAHRELIVSWAKNDAFRSIRPRGEDLVAHPPVDPFREPLDA